MTEFIRLDDGKIAINLRGTTYQARIYLGPEQGYVTRSLKTSDEAEARKRAEKVFIEIGLKQQHGLPIKSRTFRDVVDQYVKFREKEHEQGRTKASMLRQIKRVSKFWREFGGAKPVENIGDAELKDYLQWRQAYYSNVPPDQLHPNAKLNPTEKTLQWDIMLGKSIIAWAHEKGFTGNKPLPTFAFTPKKKRVRPAFELGDYRKLTRALLAWERSALIPSSCIRGSCCGTTC